MATSLADFQKEQGMSTPAPTAAPKKGGGFLSALPSLLAAGASFVPGVGTVGAGLIGGAGEAGRQLLSGEKFDLGKVGGEAALSAIPFGIGRIGKVTKLAKGAAEATKGGKAAAKTTGPSLTAFTGNKIRASGRDIQAGTKIPGTQDVLDEAQAAAINKAISGTQKGLIGRSGRGQLVGVQRAIGEQGKVIGDITNKTKVAIGKDQIGQIGQLRDKYLKKNVANFDPTNKSDVAMVNNFARQIEGAKTLPELEAVRRSFDKVAKNILKNPDRTGSLEANIAKSYRDAIDEFSTGLSPALKAAKTKYSNLRAAEDLLAKQTNPKGLALAGTTFQGKGLGGGLVQAAQETAGKALEGIGSSAALPTFGRALAGQGLTRAAAFPFGDTSPEAGAVDETASVGADGQPLDTAGFDLGATSEITDTTSEDQYSKIQSGLQEAALKALGSGDSKGLDNIIKVMGVLESLNKTAAPKKKTEAQVGREEALGISQQALADLSEGGIATGPIAPALEDVKAIFNAGDKKTVDFNRKIGALRSAIVKARGGSAVTETELKLIDEFVPKKGDSNQIIQSKLEYISKTFGKAAADFEPSNVDELNVMGA